MPLPEDPIAVFDSGFGGLTVLKALAELLPNENFLYFADTARLPYGNKGGSTIARYCQENALFLQKQQIKLLVMACNTACAFALNLVREMLSIPVIGITEQGIGDVLRLLPNHRVGILGTRSTISSGLYERALTEKSPSIQLFPLACPLFVPLVEEQYTEHKIAELVAQEYLSTLDQYQIDGLLLACTHYPLLKPVLRKVLGPDLLLIDPSFSCAKETKTLLQKHNLLNPSPSLGSYQFIVSDDTEQFRRLGQAFFNHPMDNISLSSEYCAEFL